MQNYTIVNSINPANRPSLLRAGITAHTASALRHLPLTEIHASCAIGHPQSGPAVTFGFAPPTLRRTDAAQVSALRSAFDNC